MVQQILPARRNHDLVICVCVSTVVLYLNFCEDLSVQVAFKEDLAKLDRESLRKLMVAQMYIENVREIRNDL